MNTIVEEYLAKHGHNAYEAAAALARDLMRGDPATFKQGYTMGNALISVAQMFDLSVNAVGVVVDWMLKDKPVAIIDMTGGVTQWEIVAAGIGEPDLYILDFDDEMDIEDRVMFGERYQAGLDAVRGRISATEQANMEQGIADWNEGIRELREEMQRYEEAAEIKTKRERAAALLTDAEIDGILDAHESP